MPNYETPRLQTYGKLEELTKGQVAVSHDMPEKPHPENNTPKISDEEFKLYVRMMQTYWH